MKTKVAKIYFPCWCSYSDLSVNKMKKTSQHSTTEISLVHKFFMNLKRTTYRKSYIKPREGAYLFIVVLEEESIERGLINVI